MVGISKSKRQKQQLMTNINNKKRKDHEKQLNWNEILMSFDSFTLENNKGRVRSAEENMLVLLTLKFYLRIQLDNVKNKIISITSLSWTSLETTVAEALHVKREHVTTLRKMLFEQSTVLEFGHQYGELSTRGMGSPNAKSRGKLSYDQIVALVDEVDYCHSQGMTVTNSMIRNFLRLELNADLSESSVARYFRKIGLSWMPIKSKKKNVGMYRMDALREYLIKFNELYKEYIKSPSECNFVFTFTDESYIHQGHSYEKSYLKADSIVNKKSSKGQRLIMLHAITPFGPLVERINGIPVDDLEWKGDTPHPKKRTDGKVTCELMWKASSSSGDYHDNMNSDMFFKWVVDKLVPTFELLHPGKTMILICDNAAYHHKREIGSISSKTKFQLIELCIKYEIEYIDLPMNDFRSLAMSKVDDVLDNVVALADGCRVVFDSELFLERAGNNKPFVPTLDELKIGILNYLKHQKPHLLECMVEKYLQDKGHSILWTPPYSPDLQPIELFWAAGKNHARNFVSAKTTMKETVHNVREGWYGNTELWDANVNNLQNDYRRQRKLPADCNRLFQHTVEMANNKFIPICGGISGTMGDLIIDQDHVPVWDGIPADMILNDISKLSTFDDDINDEVDSEM